jgi:hypothetical protein
MQRMFYQEYDSSDPRLKYGDIFKSSDIYWIHRMMIEGRVRNRSVSDYDLDEKYPYGIPELAAIMSDSGGENAQVMWRAIPTWGPPQGVANGLNQAAPPGILARVASWNGAMPGDLFGHVRGILIALNQDEDSADSNPSVDIGVSEAGRWISWNLNYPQPPVPDITDEYIWITSR